MNTHDALAAPLAPTVLDAPPKERGHPVRASSRKSGRPALGEAELLTPHILGVASRLFVTHGYAGTTMDLLAKQAGVSKKTIYARFSDKNQLFDLVVRDHLTRHLDTPGKAALQGHTLAERLYQFGCTFLAWSLQPEVLGLYRVAVAESPRFPQLARLVFDAGVMNANAQVQELLATSPELSQRPHAPVLPLGVLATHFLNTCIAPPFWLALQGHDAPGLDDTRRNHLRSAVTLYLHGALAVPATPSPAARN